jgi:4-diphosphocytidyl-2-methyl-D-erithritol synthase
MNIAIIFAGGVGQRAKTNIPKQFMKFTGKPIIIHTLEVFQNHEEIDEIYIACIQEWIPVLQEEAKRYKITKIRKIVKGGNSAMDSTFNALIAANKNNHGEDCIVLIHDAVRPFITKQLITDNIKDVKQYGSSITVSSMYETPIISHGGKKVDVVSDRSVSYTAQAPQAFLLNEILEAHEFSRKKDMHYNGIVDSCSLYQSLGKVAHITHGNVGNIKITTPIDFKIAKVLFEQGIDGKQQENDINRIIEEDMQKIINQDIDFSKLNNCTIFITGASGMFGTYIMHTLLELNDSLQKNITIVCLVRNVNKLKEYIRNREDIVIIEQDVCKPILYQEKIDYIIHAASPASPKLMKDYPVDTFKANVVGTLNTLELARKNDVKGYMYVSSREVYGQPLDNQNRFTETEYGLVDPLNPRSCYPEGKKASENLCASYKYQYGINVLIVRPAHTYGPGMLLDDGRVQADFLKNIIYNENIVMKSSGEAVRTYTYIADVIAGMFKVLLEKPTEEIVYNIADDNSIISIRQLANLLVGLKPEKNLKVVIESSQNQGNQGNAPFTRGTIDCGKIKSLGWKPLFSLEKGFSRTIEYLEIEENR